MASLLALLSQQTPHLQTRKGLVLLGLQNDFLSADGKLKVSTASGFVDRIRDLVPTFRQYGDIVWVRSEYEADRAVADPQDDNFEVVTFAFTSKRRHVANIGDGKRLDSPFNPGHDEDDDEEHFLTRTNEREPCCLRGSYGADFADQIKDLVQPKDVQVVKTHYSGFNSTSLLLTLRSKLITELYVCGCITNLSVYATAMDAARYGISVTLIEDCLGYRRQERHDEALRQLVNVMGAEVRTMAKTVAVLQSPGLDEIESNADESDSVSLGNVSLTAELEVGDESDAADEDDLGDLRSALSQVRLTRSSDKVSQRSDADPLAASSQQEDQSTQSEHSAEHPSSSFSLRGEGRSSSEPHCNRDPTESKGASSTCMCTSEGRIARSLSQKRKRNPSPTPWLDDLGLQPERTTQPTLKCQNRHPDPAAMAHAANLDERTILESETPAEQQKVLPRMSDQPHRQPLFGNDKLLESSGSEIVHDLLPEDEASAIFDTLKSEVKWQKMYHQTGEVPRLVCCQGSVEEDGSMPVYRHPSDESIPTHRWTLAVARVRQAAEDLVGHPLNHALIQLYRGGTDYISEHSDKTLDIAKDSKIVNASFGAQRTMRIRSKRSAATGVARTTYRVPMPHNSMLVVTQKTNEEYLHGINADKRLAFELSEAEKAYGGQRISLTFRHIATFLSADSKLIWGQGAVGKTGAEAQPTVNGGQEEGERMVRAFGVENQASSFDWEGTYGRGFNVLHLK